jgi:glycosyltransferase involved in cell wall biosynthesis
LKVLQVGTSLKGWGGIERYIAFLAKGLTDRGHEVSVAVDPGAPLVRLAPCAKLEIPSKGKHDWSAFRRYRELYRADRFDVIHVHYSPDLIVAALAAKVSRAGPVVFTRHVAEPWGRLKTRLYLSWIDHLVPVSSAVEEVLLRDGVPAARIWSAKAGCPPLMPTRSREEVRKDLGFDGFTVGIFGRLVREKGVDVAIEASARSGASIECFGDGPLRSELQAQAKARNAPIRFHGFTEDVADPMNAVDAVAIPSRWAEAFPFAALEAMSLGKPIVAADVGGLPELVSNDITGLLFRREDPVGMADKMLQLAGSPELVATLGAEAKARHRDLYTLEHMAERMERVYEAIVR